MPVPMCPGRSGTEFLTHHLTRLRLNKIPAYGNTFSVRVWKLKVTIIVNL